MATSRSLPDIRQIQEIKNSTQGFALTKQSSSLLCFSTDVSDDNNQQIQKEKRKSKKKRFKLFRKSHTERKDAENTIEQQQPASLSLKQRLTNFYQKKRKKKRYNVSHSSTVDVNNADLNQEDSIGDQHTLNDVIAMQQNEEDMVETTERDGNNAFSQRHSKTTGLFSDRSTEIKYNDRKTLPGVIYVKSNSPAGDSIRTNSRVEYHGQFEKQKGQMIDREEELARRELEILRREDEISKRENDVLSSKQDTINTLNQLSKTIDIILRTPRYVKISGCENIHIGIGNDDVQQNLGQVHSMLEGLCVKYEDIKTTTETTLESVKDLQNESTDHSEQLQKLADFLESKLRHHTSAEEPQNLPSMTKNTPEQICDHCNLAYSKPSGNIWGPSTVRNYVVSSHVKLDKNMQQLLSDVQLIKSHLVSPLEGAKYVSLKDSQKQ